MKTIQNDTDHTGPVVTMAATQCQTVDLLQVWTLKRLTHNSSHKPARITTGYIGPKISSESQLFFVSIHSIKIIFSLEVKTN